MTTLPIAAPRGTTARMRFTVPLREVGRGDLQIAGGKGANLGELMKAGQPVPPGFVVTTAAYDAVLASLGAENEPATLSARLAAAPVPEAVRVAVREAAERLGGTLAVRSSATAEDLPGAAFAGQQDTVLGVAGADAVLDAVRRCWASLWGERAVAYREHRGVDQSSMRIAVVVQRMVDADFAGVLLTADPVTGDRGATVIEANPGLGEAVVSGLVTPDRFVLDRHGRVRERRRGRREVVVRLAETGGVRQESGGEGDLPEAALRELARRGREIAAHFGAPQDIEWAVVGETCWMLQARPMTALPPAPVRVRGPRRLSTTMLAELLPVRPYPIDMTTWTTRGHGRILQRMADEIVGVRVDLARMLPEVDGVVDHIDPPPMRLTLRTLTTPARVRRSVSRFAVERWTADPRFTEYERTVAALTALEPAQLPWDALLAVPERCLEALDRLVDVRVDYLPDAGLRLARLAALLVLARRPAAWGDLIVGGRTRTADAADALRDLAAGVREDPVARAAFDVGTPDELARLVAEEPAFAVLRERVAAFQAEYGSREITSAFLVTTPTWGDDPRVVLGALQALVRREEPERDPARRADRLAHEVIARVRSAGLRRALARAVPAARAAAAFREDTHFHAMRPVPVLRRALLEIGARLALAGVLDAPEDLFSLRLDEITSLPEPHLVPAEVGADLRARVAARQARRALLAGSPLISPLTLRPKPDRSPALLTGAAAGGGRATGPVRVIRDASGFGSLRPGEVLVAPWTNPSWTPLFGVAGAVVVDTGGPASHAAIVAREYGIPAVVGTGNGTSVLQDGTVVIVDGSQGRVLEAP